MKTDVVKPQGIFFNPIRLVVPLFQRPYVWSKETQWKPLWQDIVRLIEVIEKHDQAATHFLGAIVIQQVPVGLGSLPMWNVIDGQQRLTTLQILLDALHSELARRGWVNLANRVHALIENPPEHCDNPEDRFKLWPTNRDRDGFAAVMSVPEPVNYSAIESSRLRDAHQFFAESISAWLGAGDDAEKRARVLVATITDRLEIASISLDASEDAQAIFETLNARGTPLSAADLIKNFLFQQLPAADAENAYVSGWAAFETPWWEAEVNRGRVTHTRSSLFLWQWLIARTLQEFPVREVFTQFKHYVNTVEKDVTALLPRIRAAADRYRALIEGSERSDGPLTREELFGYRVATLDSEVARPLLIWLDEPEQADISDEDRVRFLETLESWFVRRALVKAPSQGSNRFMVDLLTYLSEYPADQVADALERFLAGSQSSGGYWPDDEQVRAALTGATAYWKYVRARLRMVLEALEDDKRGYPNGRRLSLSPVVRGKATIEHLMPQEWAKHWAADLDEEQQAARRRAVQELGNLTLVTQALNSRVSNGPWQKKRVYFLESDDVLITKDALSIAGEGEWDEAGIESRTAQMIDRILAIWPVPAGHVGVIARRAEKAPTVNVDIAQLISSGWLAVGEQLVNRHKSSPTVAALAQDGRIFVGDDAYETPTAAAKAVLGRGVNGWWYWKVAATGMTLAEVRDEYVSSLGESDANLVDEVDDADAVDGDAA